IEGGVKGQRGFREGDQVNFRFRITDTTSETPLSGVYPAAWMDLKPEGEAASPQTCQDKVEAFVGGSLLTPPELDLNTYYVLGLNNDATVSVVDPLFGFGTTKLLDMIFLKSLGQDWVLTPDQRTLFISMPAVNQVAVADTATWKVTANLDTGPQPSRVALQPDARYLWVAYEAPRSPDGPSGVTVIDTQTRSVAADIPTGRGHHEIAFDADDRYAFVTNQEEGSLTVIDIRKLEKVRDIFTGPQPVSIAYSSSARSVYVTDRDSGEIVAVDAESLEITARMEAHPGLGQIRFAPEGRLGLAVNTERDTVHILDASLNRIVQTAEVEDGPDQVTFSDELAYIRHRGSELILMIPLKQLGREGQPVPLIDVTGGQNPFGKGSKPSLAPSIVQAPGANAVLVANPADQAIYYYKEGMAAPMGHFQNYSRQPRAVLAVDRSLQERSPGSYETSAILRRPGLYDVAFFLDSPRMIHCFEVRVQPNPELIAGRIKPLKVEPRIDSRDLEAGSQRLLQFRLTDPSNQKPRLDLKDVYVLTFRAPGHDQQRQKATQIGDGVYQVAFTPSQPGTYYALLACPSLGVQFNKTPFVVLRVKEGKPAKSANRGNE
ncbi:MAG: cytochrome D1 domain-containing protein, partial [Acidobacteriota bacterium]